MMNKGDDAPEDDGVEESASAQKPRLVVVGDQRQRKKLLPCMNNPAASGRLNNQ